MKFHKFGKWKTTPYGRKITKEQEDAIIAKYDWDYAIKAVKEGKKRSKNLKKY